jgi:hypothetical protein
MSVGQWSQNVRLAHWWVHSTAFLVLIVASIVFALEVYAISGANGWWLDELWSAWATDPTMAFNKAFSERIIYDTTPPLYYVVLFWTRRLIADERSAVILLNLALIAAFAAAIIVSSRKFPRLSWALIAVAAFLCSGPVLRYVVEGRAYLMAMVIAFAASWYSALAVDRQRICENRQTFALLGIIAALTHVFAALFCCCLAAGLIVYSYFDHRPRLLGPGLALGLSAGIGGLLFIAWALNLAEQASWIEFSYESMLATYWDIRQLVFGSRIAIVLFVALFLIAMLLPSARSLTVIFGVTWGLFVLIPILVSFVQPIILSRYWLSGAPSIVVFVVLLTRALAFDVHAAHPRLRMVGALACLAFLTLTGASSYSKAFSFVSDKPAWRGAELVTPVVRGCPSAAVHVNGFVNLFAAAARVSDSMFVDASFPKTPFVTAGLSSCSVLGWAEHLSPQFVLGASDEELLQLLKIDAGQSEVNIIRHAHGFVITTARCERIKSASLRAIPGILVREEVPVAEQIFRVDKC